MLEPELFSEDANLVATVQELRGRGYNTLIVPILFQGSLLLRTKADGQLHPKVCSLRKSLKQLSEIPVCIWMYLDILSAGPPESKTFGNLAQANRQWFMRNSEGGHQIEGATDVPGLFCWTAIGYRRFLGNLLVDLLDAYPIDGAVFDVRHLPLISTDPRHWSHLGYSCIRRLQRELKVDIEGFLTRPSAEEFQLVEAWRHREFEHFIEVLKARAQKSRFNLNTAFLARTYDTEQHDPHWLSVYSKGVVDQVVLAMDKEGMPHRIAELDEAAEDARSFLVAFQNEKEFSDNEEEFNKLPTSGLIVEPDLEKGDPLPPTALTWSHPGAIENHPVQAVERILKDIVERLDPADPTSMFFREMDEYFVTASDEIILKDMLRLRTDIKEIHEQIKSMEEVPDPAVRDRILVELDLVSRLLLLTPAPPIEY